MVAYSFKKRFVDQITVGLGIPVLNCINVERTDVHPKRQTIRAVGKRRHARVGDAVQLYTAMRTKQCKNIGIGRCVSFEGVMLKWSEWPAFMTYDISEREPGIWRRIGNIRPILDMEEFAKSDGFASFDDMARFWREEHGPETFEGVLIRWEPING